MSQASVVLRLVRFSLRYFVLNTLFATLSYFCVPIGLGLATQRFFDAVAGRQHGVVAWGAIALLVAILVGEAVAGPLLGNPWSPLQQKAVVLMRANLFASILRGFGHDGLPVSTGEIVSRFRDDPQIVADILDALSDLIGRSLFAIGAAILMWRISPLITLALFVPLLLCSFVTELLEARIMGYRTAARAASGIVTGFLGDVMGAQLVFNVGGATPRVIGRLSLLGDARRTAEVRDAVFDSLLDALNANLGTLGTGVVLLLGAQLIRSSTFNVGDLALFAVFLDALGWYPAEIGRVMGDLKRIDVSMGRMQAVVPSQARAALVAPSPVNLSDVRAPISRTPVPHARHGNELLTRFDVEGLTYSHAGVAHGIREVAFTLERGSFTVVTGRIGEGKSTLLQVVLGLLPRDGGEISWNGRIVTDPASFLVPPRCAYTPQVPRLFSESLRDNLLLGWSADDEALERAVHAAVLEPDIAELEDGLGTMVGPRGVKLSGGQVQRAAAARMFLRDAQLVVVDDLSSALDADTEAELWARLVARGRNQTYLVVSHRPAALRRADQLLVLEGGRLRPG